MSEPLPFNVSLLTELKAHIDSLSKRERDALGNFSGQERNVQVFALMDLDSVSRLVEEILQDRTQYNNELIAQKAKALEEAKEFATFVYNQFIEMGYPKGAEEYKQQMVEKGLMTA